MDRKQMQLIKHFHNVIISRSFDERDIYSFLMLLREVVTGDELLNEFGDFIAHRQKDRGIIFAYLKENNEKINAVVENRVPADGFTISSRDIFTIDQIKKALNRFLKQHDMTIFSTCITEMVVVCLISLLNDIRILNNKAEFGRLEFAVSKSKIILLGHVNIESKPGTTAAFHVLSVKNSFIPIEPVDEYDTPIMSSRIIQAVTRDGNLVLTFAD